MSGSLFSNTKSYAVNLEIQLIDDVHNDTIALEELNRIGNSTDALSALTFALEAFGGEFPEHLAIDSILENGSRLVEGMSLEGEEGKGFFGTIGEGIKKAWQAIYDFIARILKGIKNLWNRLFNKEQYEFDKMMDSVKEKLSDANLEKIFGKEIMQEANESYSGTFFSSGESFEEAPVVREGLTIINNKLVYQWGAPMETLASVIPGTDNYAGRIARAISHLIKTDKEVTAAVKSLRQVNSLSNEAALKESNTFFSEHGKTNIPQRTTMDDTKRITDLLLSATKNSNLKQLMKNTEANLAGLQDIAGKFVKEHKHATAMGNTDKTKIQTQQQQVRMATAVCMKMMRTLKALVSVVVGHYNAVIKRSTPLTATR